MEKLIGSVLKKITLLAPMIFAFLYAFINLLRCRQPGNGVEGNRIVAVKPLSVEHDGNGPIYCEIALEHKLKRINKISVEAIELIDGYFKCNGEYTVPGNPYYNGEGEKNFKIKLLLIKAVGNLVSITFTLHIGDKHSICSTWAYIGAGLFIEEEGGELEHVNPLNNVLRYDTRQNNS